VFGGGKLPGGGREGVDFWSYDNLEMGGILLSLLEPAILLVTPRLRVFLKTRFTVGGGGGSEP